MGSVDRLQAVAGSSRLRRTFLGGRALALDWDIFRRRNNFLFGLFAIRLVAETLAFRFSETGRDDLNVVFKTWSFERGP
jgi:hypothetical protein